MKRDSHFHKLALKFWSCLVLNMANALEVRSIAVLATLCSLWMVPVTCQDTVPVLKDNSRVLLCEHGASAIASFTWTKGSFTIIQGFISNGQMTIVVDSMPDKAELVLQNGSPNMRLDNIDIPDEGTYSCTAVEQGGAQTVLTSELLVRVQPSAPDVQVQFDPQPADMSAVPLNTTVTFTCSSTGGRPPATLTWTGAPVNPTYTSSNNSQGVGDATSTFNFTTTTYGMAYRVQCTASGPDPIQTRTSTKSFTTEPDPSATPTTPKGQTGVVTSAPNTASKSSGPGVSKAPQAGGGLDGGAIAGIIIGVILAIVLVAALVYIFVIRPGRAGREKEDGVESGDDAVTYHSPGHPGAPENLSRPPPNQPEVMYAELDLKNAPAGSRRPYVATPDDSPTEYAQIRPDKPPRSSVPHTLAPDDKTEYASISKPKPSRRLDLQAV